jgi:hypothetical protein
MRKLVWLSLLGAVVMMVSFAATQAMAAGDDDSSSGRGKTGQDGTRGFVETHQLQATSRGGKDGDDTETDNPKSEASEPVPVNGSYARLGFSTRAPGESSVAVSSEWHDRAFEKFVDLELLRTAIDSGDAAQLTDVALQFAEAERVLLRSHHDVTAEQLMRFAAKLAVGKDKATMDRLVKAAQLQKNEKLVAELEAMAKLSGKSRAINPAETVSVLDTTPEAFTTYRNMLQQLDTAKRLGNRDVLKMLEKMLQLAHGLSKQQSEYIKTSIADAEKGLPAKPDPAIEAMKRLQTASRGGVAICTKCQGTGWVTRGLAMPKRCGACGGTGWIFIPTPPASSHLTPLPTPTTYYHSTVNINNPGGWGAAVGFSISVNHGGWKAYTVENGQGIRIAGHAANTPANIGIGYWDGQGTWVQYDLANGGVYDFFRVDDGRLGLSPHQ